MNFDAENRFPNEAELETRLTAALNGLPDAPLASNFTMRVLQSIELADAQNARGGRNWNWRFLFPRFAVAAAILIFAVLGFEHYEMTSQRMSLAQTVAQVAAAPKLPSVDALNNFDAIQRMSQPHADENLLALLQ